MDDDELLRHIIFDLHAIEIIKFKLTYPKIRYYKCKTKKIYCAICHVHILPNEFVRDLNCHRFHKKCVDKWLKFNKTCPMCRKIIK